MCHTISFGPSPTIVCLISGLRSFINGRLPDSLNFQGEPQREPGFLWYLTQVLLTADGCIKTSGVGGQALIPLVEHAAGALPAPTRTVFAVAKIVG
jgi:hypothetical protein